MVKRVGASEKSGRLWEEWEEWRGVGDRGLPSAAGDRRVREVKRRKYSKVCLSEEIWTKKKRTECTFCHFCKGMETNNSAKCKDLNQTKERGEKYDTEYVVEAETAKREQSKMIEAENEAV